MSDEELHDLVERLRTAASDGLTRTDTSGLAPYLDAQLANEAALAISELTATRTLLMTRPVNWIDALDMARRH